METTLIHVGRYRGTLPAAAVCLCFASPAFAQAWVAPAGVGAITVSFQHIANTGHRMHDGSMLPGYESDSRTLSVDFDYALTDRLSFAVGAPFVASRYTGPEPSLFGLPIDDCLCWNTGWQDLSFTARYNLMNGVFALTPSVSFGTPSHAYDDIGEAVLGRNLTEWRFAIDAGRRLDAISPRLMVSARYSYAIVERVPDATGTELPNNRSNGSIEAGFMLARRLLVRGAFAWQITHGGLASTEFNENNFLLFDRVIRDNYKHVGAGVSYSFPRADVFVAYIGYVGGTDTHAGRAITVGMSLPFER